MIEKTQPSKQVKSRERVADHGEVFTNPREVNAMLDLVKHETERIDSRFLEPACGTGNFLAEILRRKLNVVNSRYSKVQLDWEYNTAIAVSSIYGVDILEDNTIECRQRLYDIFEEHYTNLFKDQCKEECQRSIRFLLERNVLWGDALDFTNPENKKPIIFAEWGALGNYSFKRRDYKFQFLVQEEYQLTMFNDEEEEVGIDLPVKDDYPITHFLELGNDAGN